MSRFNRSTGGIVAAIVGVTALLATVVTVLATGAFTPPASGASEPSGSGGKATDGLAYHFDKTLCGAMDWSPIEPVAEMADDVDAADEETRETKAITVECSVLLEGHPESQVYVNVTTFAAVADCESAYEAIKEQQRERVSEVSKLDGDWANGSLGVGHDGHELYVDALVQDSNAAGSVVVALNGDSVSDRAAQEQAAESAVAAIAASMLDVLRRG